MSVRKTVKELEEDKIFRLQQEMVREINSRMVEIDYSVFEKTESEKHKLKRLRNSWKANMRGFYGDNWRKSGYYNIPVNVEVKPETKPKRKKKYVMKNE